MKPIIIAGNGPSLAKIDYSRLPKDFDVFRCNQFYFEDKYFLGKKIKGVFFNHRLIREFFYTMQILKMRSEYEIEDLYTPLTAFFSTNQADTKYFSKIKILYPNIIDIYPLLGKNKEIYECIQYFFLYHNKFLNMGTYMIVVALAQGYQEIYLTGIDFYLDGGGYAFDMQEKHNLFEKVPGFKTQNRNHSHIASFDAKILEIIKKHKETKIFSISPSSPVSEIFPLAPQNQNSTDFKLLSKPSDFINDLQRYPKNANIDLLWNLDMEDNPNPTTIIGKIKKIMYDLGLKK